MSSRRHFSPAFRTTVAMTALAGHKTVTQLSAGFEAHPTVIRCWLRQAKGFVSDGFAGKFRNCKNQHDKQFTPMQAKPGQLTMERDFLAEAWKKM